ncbi:hypothetical protein [Mycolicibacterium sp.]|uniref:hypothetical protein n=1 Tax=Mycolicibacterium sp. TaxID=2320850 RepID=UPI0025D350DA|nr:hypothetical protein [Mycolicibacterium sp.]
MAELAAADLAAFTGGRLSATAPETASVLAAALAAARRYCGWTVSPVAEVTLTLDGPGGTVLALPTRKLISVTALSENGQSVDVSTLDISRTTGIVRKYPLARWTSRANGITVTMSHGQTEAEAADWRRAVLRLASELASDSSAKRDSADLTTKKVDDVEYQWASGLLSTNDQLAAMFAAFRILPAP